MKLYRPALALLLALLLHPTLTGCATAGYWGWASDLDTEPSYRAYVINAQTSAMNYEEGMSPFGAAFVMGLFVTPFTLAWDLITLPIQIDKGYGPFADDGEA